jgi:hypothetical protein
MTILASSLRSLYPYNDEDRRSMKPVMQHPLFGRLEWAEEMKQWNGRVQLGYFSAYDMNAEATCAARLGTEKRFTHNAGVEDNEVELNLIMPSRGEPTARQESAYRDFLEDRDRVCDRVVDAVFNLYRGHWGQWRQWGVPAEPRREEFYADDLLIPELTSRDGLKNLIALSMLSVFDYLGILGFCFGCTWDPEHGVGVLVRANKVIEVGENDITWRGSGYQGLECPPEPPTERELALQRGVAAVSKLGGIATIEVTGDGPCVQVDLVRNRQIDDADLELLKRFPILHQLQLNSDRVTDEGLATIGTFDRLQLLGIPGARVTDAGLKAIRRCKELKTLYLSGTRVTDAGLDGLHDLPKLTGLYLNGTQVTDVGMKKIGKLTGLKHLGIADSRVTDSGIAELRDLKALLTLDLHDTQVTDAALITLKGNKSLRYLDLSGCHVTNAGLEYARELKSLRSLKLAATATTEAGIAGLLEAVSGLQVDRSRS